ncbi:hypothetical protein, partial [Streptomyces sp. NPDC048419]|uniref:hypothetical protein n=1 Tax=Streptomyces sp. NPDC048419 TaxID=3365547 RepID=UPI0037150AB7
RMKEPGFTAAQLAAYPEHWTTKPPARAETTQALDTDRGALGTSPAPVQTTESAASEYAAPEELEESLVAILNDLLARPENILADAQLFREAAEQALDRLAREAEPA